jgi:hypothetical protein
MVICSMSSVHLSGPEIRDRATKGTSTRGIEQLPSDILPFLIVEKYLLGQDTSRIKRRNATKV